MTYRRYFTRVNYKKVTYRRYFTEVKYYKAGNLSRGCKHALGAFGPGADRGCLRQGSAPGWVGEDAVQRKGSLGEDFFDYSAGVPRGGVLKT